MQPRQGSERCETLFMKEVKISDPKNVLLTLDAIHSLSYRGLSHQGLNHLHADAITRVITQGERDECS